MTTLLNPARVAEPVHWRRDGQVAGLIAAHDEEAGIYEVVRGGHEHLSRWLVVADGCGDQTAKRAREAGAGVLELTHRRGKASALIRGCQHLLQDREVDAVLMLDGDGQHAPADIPKFLNAWTNGREDLLVGARDLSSSAMPWTRRWTNRLMSRVIYEMTKSPCADTQCGFRLASRAFLTSRKWHSTHFELETEMILHAGTEGWATKDIPVETIYNGNGSHIRVLPDLRRWLRLLGATSPSKHQAHSDDSVLA